jgi:hypothetical protein
MKIFVSYSSGGAVLARLIDMIFRGKHHDVFTVVNSIRAGDVWSDAIENNISNCDIFVVIITDGALHSSHVENEVLQAQREKKKIIPFFHRNVKVNDIKWGLNDFQDFKFTDMAELARSVTAFVFLHEKYYATTSSKYIQNKKYNSYSESPSKQTHPWPQAEPI